MTRLEDLAGERRAGKPQGITSICSAHPTVLRATLREALGEAGPVLIEATSNQVNQDGGYTGMTPAVFCRFIEEMAGVAGFPRDRLILGGDHLGPNPWRHLLAEDALARAEAMVAAYAAAGFSKIHLDASMGCAGEPEALDDETTARRAARLARAAESAARDASLPPPLYVIGTEVPTPGGAVHDLDTIAPTSGPAARETIATHRAIFAQEGLQAAFDRVIAVVVQPGVEFNHDRVVQYRPENARPLVATLDSEPQFVFEAHSTDYQSAESLAALVRDGFAILKVGPGLTFALREALYALDLIASELDSAYGDRPLARAMEGLMLADPQHWLRYYPGSPAEQHILRHYSYSDRIRYYWPRPKAENAVQRLMATLAGRPIPQTLLSQFLPSALETPMEGASADLLLDHAVARVLRLYRSAGRP